MKEVSSSELDKRPSQSSSELELTTKSKLLKASIEVFSRSGFAGASYRDIAEAAGLHHGLIRYHYKSKEALWKAAVSYLWTKYLREIDLSQEERNALPIIDQIKLSMRRVIRFFAKHPELYRIEIFEALSGSDRHAWLVETFHKPFVEESNRLTTIAKSAGVYPERAGNANIHYIGLSAARSIFLHASEIKRLFGIDVFDKEQVRHHEESVITYFLEHHAEMASELKMHDGPSLDD